jgi:hypothetical protein
MNGKKKKIAEQKLKKKKIKEDPLPSLATTAIQSAAQPSIRTIPVLFLEPRHRPTI